MKHSSFLDRSVLLVVAVSSVLVIGCGTAPGQNIVSDVKLKTYNQAGDAFTQLAATLATGALQLPSFHLPILDPRNPNTSYGGVGMAMDLDGHSVLTVDLNLTQSLKSPSGRAILPNGHNLPVAGLDQVIVLPLANTGSLVYVSISENAAQGHAMVGVAIPIREFDGIGGMLPGADLFTAFNIQSGVRGIAGIFTGGPGQNGIALFFDISGAVNQLKRAQNSVQLALGSVPTRGSFVALEPIAFPAVVRPLVVVEQVPSARKNQIIREKLYRMHVRKQRLNLL